MPIGPWVSEKMLTTLVRDMFHRWMSWEVGVHPMQREMTPSLIIHRTVKFNAGTRNHRGIIFVDAAHQWYPYLSTHSSIVTTTAFDSPTSGGNQRM